MTGGGIMRQSAEMTKNDVLNAEVGRIKGKDKENSQFYLGHRGQGRNAEN